MEAQDDLSRGQEYLLKMVGGETSSNRELLRQQESMLTWRTGDGLEVAQPRLQCKCSSMWSFPSFLRVFLYSVIHFQILYRIPDFVSLVLMGLPHPLSPYMYIELPPLEYERLYISSATCVF
jgi:hypothetical protein